MPLDGEFFRDFPGQSVFFCCSFLLLLVTMSGEGRVGVRKLFFVRYASVYQCHRLFCTLSCIVFEFMSNEK